MQQQGLPILWAGLAKPGDQRALHSASAPCSASPERRGKACKPRSSRNCTPCRASLYPLLFQSSRTPFARPRKPRPRNISWCPAASQVRMRFVGNSGVFVERLPSRPISALHCPRLLEAPLESEGETEVGALPKWLMWHRHPRTVRSVSKSSAIRSATDRRSLSQPSGAPNRRPF